MELKGSKDSWVDAYWVEQAKNGDRNAFSELLDRYYAGVYQWIRALVSSDQEAEDLSIESFTKAFINIASYRKEYAFSTWLFRIAKNHCIDYMRRNKHPLMFTDQFYILENSLESCVDNINETPETILVKQQTGQAVQKVVNDLNPHYSKLIQLRYFHDYSYVEISKALNLSVDMIKVQLFRAKKRLKIMVQKEDFKKSIGFEM